MESHVDQARVSEVLSGLFGWHFSHLSKVSTGPRKVSLHFGRWMERASMLTEMWLLFSLSVDGGCEVIFVQPVPVGRIKERIKELMMDLSVLRRQMLQDIAEAVH